MKFILGLLAIFLLNVELCEAFEIIQEEPRQEHRFIVHPAKMETEIQNGQTREFDLIVVNRLGRQSEFFINKKFSEENEYGDTEKKEAADWIQLEKERFILSDGERAISKVKITVPSKTKGGGYYLDIIISTKEEENSSEYNLELVSQIRIPILLKVPGENLKEKAEVSFKAKKLFFLQGPIDFLAKIKNDGNVHEMLSGEISIFNSLGSQIAQIPWKSVLVLPGEEKDFFIKWSKKFPIGFYRANISVNDFNVKDIKIDDNQTWFFVFPIHWVLLFLILSWLFCKIIKKIKEKYKLKFSFRIFKKE